MSLNRSFYYFVIPPLILSILYSILHITNIVDAPLQSEVHPSFKIPWLEHKGHYALLLGVSLFFPLLLSFDKKVRFWKSWYSVLIASIVVGLFYVLWDFFFTLAGVWGFNSTYYLAGSFIGLPWEEIAFFLVIPYCCLFIYECLNEYTKPSNWKYESRFSILFMILMAVVGILYYDRIYTSVTFLFAAAMIVYQFIYISTIQRRRIYQAWLISLIPFLLINGSLTGGFTLAPVVLYSPSEIIGIRIYTVPIEDAIYLYGYLVWLISLFDYFNKK